MRIIIQDPPTGGEETITISVKSITEKITRAINLLKSPDDLTVFRADDHAQSLMLPVANVFYVESVDLKTFVYAEKAVYRSRLKLYEIEDILISGDFLRISKQIIVNVRKIRNVAPSGDGKFAANLINGETVIISRQYVPALKERFGL